MRRWNLLAAMAIASIAACLPEQERTNYGPPESLGTRQFPKPQGGDDNGDAGAPSTSTLCGGKGPVATSCDGASWKKDIFGAMLSATGTMKCGGSSGCHAPGGLTPTISGTDSDAAYASLAAFKLSNKPYIDVCTTNNADTSAIHGNLSGALSPQMPESPGVPATADQLATIDTWLKCGAPNN